MSFNESYPSDTNENQLIALNIHMIDTAKTFLIINDDGTVSVSKDGFYNISLKQGYEVIKGSSLLEMHVYINGTNVEDLSTKVSLSSSFKLSYSTGNVTLRLFPTDKIKVTTKWSDTSVTITNNSLLQVTKYSDCPENVDFGTLDDETFPYVGYARVGSARLLLGTTEDESGEIDVAMYTLPLADYAAADKSILKEL